MNSSLPPPLRTGLVFEINFPTFRPRISLLSERTLKVEIVSGDNVGFTDTIDYEVVAVRDHLVMLTWREHIGSTIVHVLDFTAAKAFTAVTTASGRFMRRRPDAEIVFAGEVSF
jgi:hypothetical protein